MLLLLLLLLLLILLLILQILHPVSVTRFPSFRTQTLENLSHYLRTDGFLSNPDPGENLVMENLVMETGCSIYSEGSSPICITRGNIGFFFFNYPARVFFLLLFFLFSFFNHPFLYIWVMLPLIYNI